MISETTQYKLTTQPSAVHSIARDVMKRGRAHCAGLTYGVGYVAEENRVVVWPVGGNKMFELQVPNPVFSVYVTEESGAIVTTGMCYNH